MLPIITNIVGRDICCRFSMTPSELWQSDCILLIYAYITIFDTMLFSKIFNNFFKLNELKSEILLFLTNIDFYVSFCLLGGQTTLLLSFHLAGTTWLVLPNRKQTFVTHVTSQTKNLIPEHISLLCHFMPEQQKWHILMVELKDDTASVGLSP